MGDINREIEDENILETDFLRILCYNFEEKYKCKYKTSQYIRLCIILMGEKNIKIGERNYTYNENQIMVLSPYLEVEVETLKPTKALVIEISDKLIENIKNKININTKYDFDIEFNELLLKKEQLKFSKDINKILDTFLGDSQDKKFLIDLYSQELVYNMLHMNKINFILNKGFNNPINKSIELMKNNILEEITITDIAKELDMSISNFSSKFKAVVGVSPNIYFTRLKLNKAKDMLKYKSVTQVSYDLGYDNISHFIDLFKRNYGITPKQYLLKLGS